MELWVAVVTSVAGLLVAMVSGAVSLRVIRNTNRSATEIELLKGRLNQLDRVGAIASQELTASLEALRTSIRRIQQLKDALQFVARSGPASQSYVSDLRTAADQLVRAYADGLPNLEETAARAFHEAKGIAANVLLMVSTKDIPVIGTTPDATARKLGRLRSRLTEAQQALRDALTHQIVDMMQKGAVDGAQLQITEVSSLDRR